MASKETLQRYEAEAVKIIDDIVQKIKSKGDQYIVDKYLIERPSTDLNADQLVDDFAALARTKKDGKFVYRYIANLSILDKSYATFQLGSKNLTIVGDEEKYSLNLPEFMKLYDAILGKVWKQFNELAKERNQDPNRNGEKGASTIPLNGKIFDRLIENLFRAINYDNVKYHKASSSANVGY